MNKEITYIKDLQEHINETVQLSGWVYNMRSSGSLVFIECRDGSGICQCILNKEELSDNEWTIASGLKQESAIQISGRVVADERSLGGVELQVTGISLIQQVEDYPITPKEHGVEFLMNHRHLWLRSQRQDRKSVV